VADNVYDFLNKFKLSDVGRALAPYLKPSGLPAYAMSGPEYQRQKEAAMSPLERRAMYGPLGDMESENIPTYDSASGKYIYDGMVADSGQPPAAPVKTYAATPEGQFERYFKTPEMDQYFGGTSRGEAAPADVAAMDKLASGKGVPEGTGIATKYRAESAMGRGNIDEIVEAMGYKGSPMETWARSNPMLAFREYNKKFPAGEPTIGPTPAALQASEGPMTAFGQEVKTFFPGAEPGADADMDRLEGEELIDAYNYMRGQKGGSREPVSNRVGAFLGKYGDLGALTK
jgi:hypothetical protein